VDECLNFLSHYRGAPQIVFIIVRVIAAVLLVWAFAKAADGVTLEVVRFDLVMAEDRNEWRAQVEFHNFKPDSPTEGRHSRGSGARRVRLFLLIGESLPVSSACAPRLHYHRAKYLSHSLVKRVLRLL